MDFYGLGQLLGQLISAVGGPAALFAVAVGGAIYLIRERLKVMEARTDVEAQSKAAERQAMLDELAASRVQINTFLTDHLEHLRVERDEFLKIQQENAATQAKTAQILDQLLGKVNDLKEQGEAIRRDVAGAG